tara:strand:- start:210 stop:1445 length:1236 start_codon:yes stop_codon:yes gene_type:complete
MAINRLKEIEAETLANFKKHRPSEYFSHLDGESPFEDLKKTVESVYRYGLCFPPEFFDGKSLIDLGSGTGDWIIFSAIWGAKCTLVEINDDAIEIAKDVFKKHSPKYEDHSFINSSLFDFDYPSNQEKFDIGHSRGVLTHVADKKLGFKILASLIKPGGYLIFSDRNTAGGIQEMLQRFAIYQLGGVNDEKIVEISEALFSDDIDRSVKALPRTREAVIFDRWTIQQQDDPSVEEILGFFKENRINYVSSWPSIEYPGRGASSISNPLEIDDATLIKGTRLIENLWLILNKGDRENLESFSGNILDNSYLEKFSKLEKDLRCCRIDNDLGTSDLTETFGDLKELISDFNINKDNSIKNRLKLFFEEVIKFIELIDDKKDLTSIRSEIDKFKILFKGYTGVRDVLFLGYKEK